MHGIENKLFRRSGRGFKIEMHTRVADQLEGEYRYKESDSEEIRRRSTLEDGSLILSEGQTQQAFDAAAQQRLGSIDSAPLHHD